MPNPSPPRTPAEDPASAPLQAARPKLWAHRSVRGAVKVALFLLLAGWALWRFKFAPLPVAVHVTGPETVIVEVMGTGTLEARVQATISPKIAGRLREVPADQNDAVVAGGLLALLDDAELRQQVAIAQATLETARAAVQRARADEARAQVVLHQAEVDHRRATDLLTNRVASAAEADKAREHLRTSEADLARAQAAGIETERQVLTAERTLAYQAARLADSRLEAPFAGLVVRRHREPGDVVVPGSAVLTLVDTNELWVSAWVDETALSTLAPGQPARVVFRSEAHRAYPGEVARLGRETDRETREFLVDVRLSALPANWAVGQRAEVFIQTKRKEAAVTVPSEFVHWRQGQPGVFVNTSGQARWQRVDLGLRGARLVEVVGDLAAGTQVLKAAGPQARELVDRQRIRAL